MCGLLFDKTIAITCIVQYELIKIPYILLSPMMAKLFCKGLTVWQESAQNSNILVMYWKVNCFRHSYDCRVKPKRDRFIVKIILKTAQNGQYSVKTPVSKTYYRSYCGVLAIRLPFFSFGYKMFILATSCS